MPSARVCVRECLSMFSQTNEALIWIRVGDKDGMLRGGGMGPGLMRMLLDAVCGYKALDVSLSSTFTCFNTQTAGNAVQIYNNRINSSKQAGIISMFCTSRTKPAFK